MLTVFLYGPGPALVNRQVFANRVRPCGSPQFVDVQAKLPITDRDRDPGASAPRVFWHRRSFLVVGGPFLPIERRAGQTSSSSFVLVRVQIGRASCRERV